MILNTRTYVEVMKDVDANLAKYEISASVVEFFQSICQGLEHL